MTLKKYPVTGKVVAVNHIENGGLFKVVGFEENSAPPIRVKMISLEKHPAGTKLRPQFFPIRELIEPSVEQLTNALLAAYED